MARLLNQAELRRRKALADALAGVVASLVSLWTFYPMDVLKTKLQAGTHETHDDGSNYDENDDDNCTDEDKEEEDCYNDGNEQKKKHWNQGALLILMSSLPSLFRGLHLKTMHAASSSFCYFYLYSWIASWWMQNTAKNGERSSMSPVERLSLSALAAMLNTCITLPLDVLASKHQASKPKTTKRGPEAHQRRRQKKTIMEDVWNQVAFDNDSCSEQQQLLYNKERNPALSSTSLSSSQTSRNEEKQNDESTIPMASSSKLSKCRVNITITPTTSSTSLVSKSKNAMSTFDKLPSFSTSGIFTSFPNSTSNGHRSRRRRPKGSNCDDNDDDDDDDDNDSSLGSLWKGLYPSLLLCSNPSIHYTVFDTAKSYLLQSMSASKKTNLSMMEAFVLGLFAKFCATITTYPLIRAKVMLMVTSRQSMVHTLVSIYQQDGICKGWYKGCSVQLLHTLLKSALLMMVKERIERTTRRLLVPQSLPTTQQSL